MTKNDNDNYLQVTILLLYNSTEDDFYRKAFAEFLFYLLNIYYTGEIFSIKRQGLKGFKKTIFLKLYV